MNARRIPRASTLTSAAATAGLLAGCFAIFLLLLLLFSPEQSPDDRIATAFNSVFLVFFVVLSAATLWFARATRRFACSACGSEVHKFDAWCDRCKATLRH